MIPFFVDAEFWTPSDERRGDFLFCPGANDRDPEVLLSLAEKGFKVVWLTSPDLLKAWKEYHERLTVVASIPFSELRDYYRRCRAVILPLRQDLHCAGQTTTMEGLCCGATVYLSRGRTSTIFAGCDAVRVIDQAAQWSEFDFGKEGDGRDWVRSVLLARSEERLAALFAT